MSSLRLDYALRFEGAWHVGSGHDRGTIDRAALLDFRGLPLLPGSALKGIIREQSECVARAVGLRVRGPHTQRGEALEHFVSLRRSPFPIERLFGTGFSGDRVFVSDATAPPETATPLRTLAVPRVSIDRYLGRARDRRLFSTEVLPPSTPLVGRIRCEHRDEELTDFLGTGVPAWPVEWAFLLAGLRCLEQVGGERSIGRGRCEIEVRAAHARVGGREMRADSGESVRSLLREILAPLTEEPCVTLEVLGFFDEVRTEGAKSLGAICSTARELGGATTLAEWKAALSMTPDVAEEVA